MPNPKESSLSTRRVAALVLILAVGVLSACGGGSDGESGDIDVINPGADNLLPPLPSPALTSAPSQDDEPLSESGDLNTISDFVVVRDAGVPLPDVKVATLTIEDFNAGVPAPVIDIPPTVDPATNAAPFFEGLENPELFAGEILEIVYRPLDTDGDLPGMFPNDLPKGASFDDNFDGSKTFRWQPLQGDVGIREFAVTAVDAANPAYRSTQNIRIKINLPEDESAIPNVAPTLDRLPDFEYTVRVGDPVVVELKGIDLNGTIPVIEISEAPEGASFNAHPFRDGIFVLKFVPTTIGVLDLTVLVRDSVDPGLSTLENFDITVAGADFPARTGERLKSLAAERSILFGYASADEFYHQPDGALYAEIATSEFDFVTPEGSMKMGLINPLPGRYDFARADNLVRFARQNNMQIHGHTLVWHRLLPEWILNAPAADIEGHMREHIDRVMTRYRNDVNLWDVVNEPIAEFGGFRDSIWFSAMGESYVATALRQARQTDPDASLLINEFDVAVPGPKQDTFFEMLDDLIANDVPLDGIGFQLHVFTSFDQFDDVRAAFQRVADLDLDIYITELDVSLEGGANNETQANVFRQLVSLCLEQARCKAVQTWGFTDQYSFRRMFNPLIFDRSYQEKPAYGAVQDALSN